MKIEKRVEIIGNLIEIASKHKNIPLESVGVIEEDKELSVTLSLKKKNANDGNETEKVHVIFTVYNDKKYTEIHVNHDDEKQFDLGKHQEDKNILDFFNYTFNTLKKILDSNNIKLDTTKEPTYHYAHLIPHILKTLIIGAKTTDFTVTTTAEGVNRGKVPCVYIHSSIRRTGVTILFDGNGSMGLKLSGDNTVYPYTDNLLVSLMKKDTDIR